MTLGEKSSMRFTRLVNSRHDGHAVTTPPHGKEKSAYRALANTRVLPAVVADSVDVDAVVMGADGQEGPICRNMQTTFILKINTYQ